MGGRFIALSPPGHTGPLRFGCVYSLGMPSQTYTHSVMIPSPSEEVWDRLQHPTSWEAIPGVDTVTDPESAPDGSLLGFKFSTDLAGRAYRGTAVITGSEPPHRMTNEIESSEIRGTVEITLEETGMDTFLMVKMVVSPVGVLSSVAFPVISAAIWSGFPGAVEHFATPDQG